jgi:hypothetical protein
MFGWFSAKCPVSEESREWVDRRMAWLGESFGVERIRTAAVILPTPEFFPDEYDGTEAAAGRLFDRVCRYAGVDRSRVDLHWVTGRPDRMDRKLFIQSEDAGAAGTYSAFEAGGLRREIISLDRLNLRDPMTLVATAAHELCHVHLLGDRRLSRDEEDHEPLTDLLTVCLGLGIFGANSSVRDSAWSDSERHGWSVSRLGYLHQATWGYALAAFANVRQEAKPGWARHLRPDVRAAFRSSIRYLSK